MSNRDIYRDRSPVRRDSRDDGRYRRDDNGGRGRSPDRERSYRDRDAPRDSRDNRDARDTRDGRSNVDNRDRRDRDDRDRRDTKRSRSRSPVRSRDDRPVDRSASSTTATAPASSKPIQTTAQDRAKSKAALEQARKERIALLKNITGADHSDEDKPKEKRARREIEGGGGVGGAEGAGAGGADGESEEQDEEEDMMEMLGFGGFGSTKGKQVADNELGAAAGGVSKHRKRQYRQYMNRKGGFNRPLQKID